MEKWKIAQQPESRAIASHLAGLHGARRNQHGLIADAFERFEFGGKEVVVDVRSVAESVRLD